MKFQDLMIKDHLSKTILIVEVNFDPKYSYRNS